MAAVALADQVELDRMALEQLAVLATHTHGRLPLVEQLLQGLAETATSRAVSTVVVAAVEASRTQARRVETASS
jgi:hypothetical protein